MRNPVIIRVAAAMLAVCGAALAQRAFTVVDLGTLPGLAASSAAAINNRGQVAGTAEDAFSARAFLYQNGVMTPLGALSSRDSRANAINNQGWIAGSATTAAGLRHAVLWRDGAITDLGTLGGTTSEALAVNELGHVAGYAFTASGDSHAFLWQDGVMTDLGTFGGSFSQALSINNRGVVVGSATPPGLPFYQAFQWQSGVLRSLGTLGIVSCAYAVNDRDQIVGLADHIRFRAFLWSRGSYTILPSLRDWEHFYATAINAQGDIAGIAMTIMPYDSYAVLWKSGGPPIELPSLGGRQSSAAAINSRGEIAGYSTTASGLQRAVVWR